MKSSRVPSTRAVSRPASRPSTRARPIRAGLVLAGSVAALLLGPSLPAATLTWDGGDATHNAAFGGTGGWDLSLPNWDNGTAEVAWSDVSARGVDQAIFTGTAGAVTLNTSLTAAGLQFLTSGYGISGTGTLTLGYNGINAGTLAAGSTTTIANSLVLGTAQTWSVAAGTTLTVSGTLSRSAGATLLLNSTGGTVAAPALTNTNSILGGWALVNTGTSYAYATVSGGNLVAYAGAMQEANSASAWGGIASGDSSSVNYDISASGSLPVTGLQRLVNTLRFTGTAATTQPSNTGGTAGGDLLVTNAILNDAGGLLTLGTTTNHLNVLAGPGKELVLGAMLNDFTLLGSVKDNAAGASALTIVGGSTARTVTLTSASTYTGGTFINSGALSISADNQLGAAANPATLRGGILRTTGTAVITDTHAFTIGPAGGTLNITNPQYYFATTNTLQGNGPLTITGTNTLIANSGNLRLDQVNPYSGAVTLQAGGNFEYGINNAVAAGATFNVANQGELEVQGGSAVTLPNAVTISGGTNSVLSFENGTLGTFSGPIAANGTLTVGLRDWYNYATVRSGTISGIISGAGGLTTTTGTGTAAATLTLSGANTFTGPITINGGVVTAGAATVAGVSSPLGINPAITFANTANAGLDLGNFNTQVSSLNGGGAAGGNINLGTATLTTGVDNSTATYGGTIAGTGGLTKVGTGVFTLTGAEAYSGPTTINAGTLTVAQSLAPGSTVNVNAGATLTGAHTAGAFSLIGGPIVLAGGPGASSQGTLNLSDGVLNTLYGGALTVGGTAGNFSQINFDASGLGGDTVTLSGGMLTVNAGGARLTIATQPGLASGQTVPLLTYASGAGAGFAIGSGVTVGGLTLTNPALSFGVSGTLNVTATEVDLVTTGVAALTNAYWKGDLGSTWASTSGAQGNFTTDKAGSTHVGTYPSAGTTVIYAATGAAHLADSTLGQDFTINGLTFDGTTAAASIGGTNTLNLSAGGVTLAAGNGGATLAMSTLAVGADHTWANNSANALNVSAKVISAGGVGTNTLTVSNSGAGATNISGVLADGAAANPLALQINGGGAGATVLSGANSYTGGTIVSAGRLRLSGLGTLGATGSTLTMNGGVLDLNAVPLAIGNLTGFGGTILNDGATAATLTIGTNNTGSGTFTGVLANNDNAGAGTLALNKTGTAGVTLTGANTYSGGTSITGALTAGVNSALGTGAVTVNAGAGNQLNLADGVNVSNALTLAGGGVVAQGALYVPGGNATYSGPINITGVTQAGGDFATNTGILTIAGDNTITSTQPVTVRNGTVIFSGAQSYATGTTLANGGATIQFAMTTSMPATGAVSILASAGLSINVGGTGEFTSGTTGAGTVGGLLGGTGGQGAAVTLASGAIFGVDTSHATAAQTYAGDIRNTGLAFLKLGAGTFTVANPDADTYTGFTVVRGGTLELSGVGGYTGGGIVTLIDNTATSTSNAVLKISSNVAASQLYLGDRAGNGQAAAVYQTAGAVTVSQAAGVNNVRIGSQTGGGSGYYKITGGSLAANEIGIGASSNDTVGVVEVAGGSLNIAGYITEGRGGGLSSGLLNITGGSASAARASLNWAGTSGAESILNIGGGSGAATLALTGSATIGLDLANTTVGGTAGVANLLANGTLSTGLVTGSLAGPAALLNFNGGTLQAAAVNAGTGFLSARLDAVTVFAGGGTIDNNSTNITLGAPLAAPSGLGVLTVPVLSGGSGYVGAPLVIFGDALGTTATAVANMVDDGSGNGTFKIASITITNPGNYSLAPTFVTLRGGGAAVGASLDVPTVGTVAGGGMAFKGSGTTTLSGTNSYTGPTNISGGTVLLAGSLSGTASVNVNGGGTLRLGAANTVNDAASFTLGNGVFSTQGFSETVGPLTLAAGASALDLGAGASIVHFGDSHSFAWSGTLSIVNWDGTTSGGGTDELFFGSSASGLSAAQVGMIQFVNPAGFGAGTYAARLLGSGEVVAIPEPGSLAAFGLGVGALLIGRRFRRRTLPL